MYIKHSHCSYCGHAFENNQQWPRKCTFCKNTTFRNPIPVAVVLLPLDEGVLVIRRGIEPQKGALALPGGFVDLNETWQEGAARELFEETGITILPSEVKELCVHSVSEGMVIIFGVANRRMLNDLPPFQPTIETTESLVVTGPQPLGFPTHTLALQQYFSENK